VFSIGGNVDVNDGSDDGEYYDDEDEEENQKNDGPGVVTD
jgi:hypothetical protein